MHIVCVYVYRRYERELAGGEVLILARYRIFPCATPPPRAASHSSSHFQFSIYGIVIINSCALFPSFAAHTPRPPPPPPPLPLLAKQSNLQPRTRQPLHATAR